MAKKKQENPSEQPTKPPAASRVQAARSAEKRPSREIPWHPLWRTLISLLVIAHLTAVFSAPWDLLTQDALPPGSKPLRWMSPEELRFVAQHEIQVPLITRTLHRDVFHDYLNLLYLNHGYEFFAPDPAGTHVIDYQVTPTDGKVVEGRLPSHDAHWPRLLYHRHMMLAEQTQLMPQSAERYAEHLATLHNGRSRLELKMHLLLPPDRISAETPLDDPSTYQSIGVVNGRPRAVRIDTQLPGPTPEAQQ